MGEYINAFYQSARAPGRASTPTTSVARPAAFPEGPAKATEGDRNPRRITGEEANRAWSNDTEFCPASMGPVGTAGLGCLGGLPFFRDGTTEIPLLPEAPDHLIRLQQRFTPEPYAAWGP
jgi:hypothetical protein